VTEVHLRLRVVRIRNGSGLEMCGGFREPALLRERQAEQTLRLRVVGTQLHAAT